MNIDIPQRPDNDEKYGALTKIEKEMVVTAVLRKVPNRTAFLWFNPHYAVMAGKPDKNGFSSFRLSEKGEEQSDLFWRYPKVREFRADYERTLEEFFGKRQTNRSVDTEIDDTRIEGALKKLLNQTIGLLDNGDNLDPDSVKTIVEVFRKMNLLKDDVEQEIRPVRVLPSRCSECRMRIAVESMVLNGEMLDMCAYCKCRRIAEDNGYRFNDGKDLLEIPEDVIKTLEEKNDVKLTDILNCKIEN